MRKNESDEQGGTPNPPEWLVDWQKELVRKGATYEGIVLETSLEGIRNAAPCYHCGFPTVKVLTHHSVVTHDKQLIVGTENMPGYQCGSCSTYILPDEPDLTGPIEYLSHEGVIEFGTKAADLLHKRGYNVEANAFREGVTRSENVLRDLKSR